MSQPSATAVARGSTSDALARALATLNTIILDKDRQLRLALSCLLARGHLLIEDVPGVGKTTLAHGLARVLGLSYQRIQFTSDLLPADILGASIFEQNSQKFRFHKGPIFTQLMLADEVNRATPKTQSALLEVMEEHQVTVDGETYPLPEPFFVIATQNPATHVGTFPLPESQLDRFLMRIELGFPGHELERQLLLGQDRRELIGVTDPCLNSEMLARLQREVLEVHVSPALLDYVQALVAHTRQTPGLTPGLSPRAAIALLRASQAWALLHRQEAVLPEHVQATLASVVLHRLPLETSSESRDTVYRAIIEAVPIP
jgi:MoxR-like ATPase